ncbi:hypothetical protein JHK85_056196 [Glycine max]|nr:hypothetical protein JHK85_056196 [Glycine max]
MSQKGSPTFNEARAVDFIEENGIMADICESISGSHAMLLFISNRAELLKYPDAKVISLGIGDTTQPILVVITDAMSKFFSSASCFVNIGRGQIYSAFSLSDGYREPIHVH